ncbi:zf-MYND and TPR domain-containing protein [Skeletonema marinoi]|uniref:Zf-MYND and TPR domain-containing protein n=1 Tax=Skeletonema marinoi TaxID=267567 RepID=A0AAD8Y1X6_9STRA|nr:zf-MYND and TPR domain-containing protein [Skeletonema marinoi]
MDKLKRSLDISNMVIEDGEESGNGASGKAGETLCCASCGIAEVDDIKLTTCDANYKLVRYCSDACQRDHRPQHKEECKKRVAELRDELLFVQPESNHLGDCPICFLPLAIDGSKRVMMSCCSKQNPSLKRKCPFCRHPVPTTNAESDANRMKRVEVNDPVAMRQMGIRRYSEGDYGSAFEYLTKAAQMGDVEAHDYLSLMYWKGTGVEKDEEKGNYHAEEAAIAGHPEARFNLGSIEWNNGSKERAVKHFVIAANLGDDKSVEILKMGHLRGLVSKEDFAAALRAHQAAVDATKSPGRDAAAAEQARRRNAK